MTATPTMSPVERRLAEALDRLAAAAPASLAKTWRRAFGHAAPAGLSRLLMLRVLSYRLQAEAFGDLDRETARALDRMTGAGGAETIPMPDRRGSQPGTMLAREWQGEMHTVMVIGDGYVWKGGRYKSLSEVAHAITGTKWNGPRFFGLRGAKISRPESEPTQPGTRPPRSDAGPFPSGDSPRSGARLARPGAKPARPGAKRAQPGAMPARPGAKPLRSATPTKPGAKNSGSPG